MECEQQAWEEHFSIEGIEEEQEEVAMWAGLCVKGSGEGS